MFPMTHQHSQYEFESHPSTRLVDHLKAVGELARIHWEQTGLNGQEAEAVELIGKLHDFGKYTKYFQDWIKEHRNSPNKSHAPISALAGAWVIHNKFKSDKLTVYALICILSHHGKLKGIDEAEKFISDRSQCENQFESLRKNKDKITRELESIGVNLYGFFEKYDDVWPQLKKAVRRFNGTLGNGSLKYFMELKLFFSCLIDADKLCASKTGKPARVRLNPDAVKRHIDSMNPTRSIDCLRRRVFDEVMETVKAAPDKRIYSINAPTGLGKTYAGFNAALHIREAHGKNGCQPRIIYSLPYINIIEQVYDTLSSLNLGGEPGSEQQVIVKDHHLAFPQITENEEKSLDELLLLQEAWESEIVVTTFSKLFEALIGRSNASLKKFHNLANSIIILDEIQTLPIEYWRLVREIMAEAANTLNVKFILMTATMPKITEIDKPLIQDAEKYFGELDRVVYHGLAEYTLQEFIEWFQEKMKKNTSALIVVNTISFSIKMYTELKQRLGLTPLLGPEQVDPRGKYIAYLSTNITPEDRARRLKRIRELTTNKVKTVVVSTQVVEAGVDLDFNTVIRELAPVDSVIQAGGRCNRSGTEFRADEWTLVFKENVEGSEKVYGRIHMALAADHLKVDLKEREVPQLMEKYYDALNERQRPETSDKSTTLLENLKYLMLSCVDDFSLIEETPRVAVFFDDDEQKTKISELYDKYKETVRTGNLKDVLNSLAEIRKYKAQLENSIVNVLPNRAEQVPSEELWPGSGIRFIPAEKKGEYYDAETGFRASSGFTDW